MSRQSISRRLPSGDEVLVRPIRPEDKRGLLEGVERLGPESRYRRFLSATPTLSKAALRYLTEVDHHDHEALLAVDPSTRDGLGVARFVRSSEDPSVAEAAVAVTDSWQRRGLGTTLLVELAARAREEGIEHFSALVLAENDAIIELLLRLGDVQVTGRGDGVVELLMELPDEGIPETLRHTVRAAARGELAIERRDPAKRGAR
jgi:GNAT superfamily N-acetyltransferase